MTPQNSSLPGPLARWVSKQATPAAAPAALRAERIQLIKRISELRRRPLIVYATTSSPAPQVTAHINDEDLVPLSELLDGIEGDAVDVLLETPGGVAETVIKIVALLRPRFKHVGFIVPHHAMSAGTILVMSGDEILMDHRSSLGPIDPQFPGPDGKLRPAQAILDGIETISAETKQNGGKLNPVHIPILGKVDPGTLQSAKNASQLSRSLVSDWLVRYKFVDWTTHNSTGASVSSEDRQTRAEQIAAELCNHAKWLSHSRPIDIVALNKMKLQVNDYGQKPELQRAVWDLWVSLHLLLSSTNIYKIFESGTLEFSKAGVLQPAQIATQPPAGQPAGQQGLGIPMALPQGAAVTAGKIDLTCGRCGKVHILGFRFTKGAPLPSGAQPFPKTAILACVCGHVHNLQAAKMGVEMQTKMPMVFD